MSSSGSPTARARAAAAGGPSPAVDVAPFDLPGRGPRRRVVSARSDGHALRGATARRGLVAVGDPRRRAGAARPQRDARRSSPGPCTASGSTPRGEHLRALRARHERVFIAGVSLGGLLALALRFRRARRRGGRGGHAAASLALGRRARPVARSLRALRRRTWRLGHPGARRPWPTPELRRDAARQRARADAPAATGATTPRARERADPDRPRRARPHRAPVRCAIDPCERGLAPSVELLVLEASGHVATVDYDGALLASAAADFLNRFA